MARVSLKYQVISLIVFIILAIACVVIVITLPAIRHIQGLSASISATERILENQYEKTKHMRKSVQELPDIIDQATILQSAALKRGAELSLITALEELAAKNHVKQQLDVVFTDLNAESPAPVKTGTKALHLPYYTVSVTANGDFKSLLAYLKSLEDLPTYISIDNLFMEKKPNINDQSPPLTLRFDGRVYVSVLQSYAP